jgi:hypothetical protein
MAGLVRLSLVIMDVYGDRKNGAHLTTQQKVNINGHDVATSTSTSTNTKYATMVCYAVRCIAVDGVQWSA